MGEYVYRTIMIESHNETTIELAKSIFYGILRSSAGGDQLKVDKRKVGSVRACANSYYGLSIGPSGGKVGGAIDRRWSILVESWKNEVLSRRLGIYWIEVQSGEDGNCIADTSTLFEGRTSQKLHSAEGGSHVN